MLLLRRIRKTLMSAWRRSRVDDDAPPLAVSDVVYAAVHVCSGFVRENGGTFTVRLDVSSGPGTRNGVTSAFIAVAGKPSARRRVAVCTSSSTLVKTI